MTLNISAQVGRPKKPPPVFHAPQNNVSADRKHQTSKGVKRSAAGRFVQRPSSASSREFPHWNVLRVFPSGFPQRHGMLLLQALNWKRTVIFLFVSERSSSSHFRIRSSIVAFRNTLGSSISVARGFDLLILFLNPNPEFCCPFPYALRLGRKPRAFCAPFRSYLMSRLLCCQEACRACNHV